MVSAVVAACDGCPVRQRNAVGRSAIFGSTNYSSAGFAATLGFGSPETVMRGVALCAYNCRCDLFFISVCSKCAEAFLVPVCRTHSQAGSPTLGLALAVLVRVKRFVSESCAREGLGCG